jgi:hypothetical protein
MESESSMSSSSNAMPGGWNGIEPVAMRMNSPVSF